MTDPMPDWIAALVAHLRADAGVTALCATAAIRGDPLGGTGAPDYAISLQRAGGPGAFWYTPMMEVRVDVRCYGPTGYEATHVWRVVHAALEADRQRNGFTAASCRVRDIHLVSAPIDNLNDAGWPLTLASYQLLVSEVSV